MVKIALGFGGNRMGSDRSGMAATATRSVTLAHGEQRTRSQSETALVLRQLRRNRGAMAGGVVLVLLIVVAIAAPLLAPHDPTVGNLRAAMVKPDRQYPLGTDPFGRDMLSRVIYGARISLRLGLITLAISATGGVLLGILAGFYGGWVDTLISRLIDIKLAFPGILLALVIVAALGPSLHNVMIAVGISGMDSYTRLVRSSTLQVRELDFVLGARAVGCPSGYLMRRYILPNVLPPVIVVATLGVAGAILAAAGLSFIGLGAQPPTPEWGAMLSDGRNYIRDAWWLTVIPGAAIMITVLSLNMLGDGLRDALDPRLRH
jgi:peptide/nickel transport system permease protein